MIAIPADDTILLKILGSFIEPVEIYDPAGKLLGLFVPSNLERCKELQAKADAQTDWAEIERRRQSKEPGLPYEVVQLHRRLLQAEVDRRKASGERPLTPDEGVAFIDRLRREGRPGNGEATSLPAEQDKCATR
jgi:hypothetical protein